MAVTISGLVNRYCGDCAGTGLNKTFILQRVNTPGSYCRYTYVFPEDSPCDASIITLSIVSDNITCQCDSGIWVFQNTIIAPINCNSTFDLNQLYGVNCDTTGATCHVVAIP